VYGYEVDFVCIVLFGYSVGGYFVVWVVMWLMMVVIVVVSLGGVFDFELVV